jgi:hypothetical protein
VLFLLLISAVAGCTQTEEAAEAKMIRNAKSGGDILTFYALWDETFIEAATMMFDGISSAFSEKLRKKAEIKYRKKKTPLLFLFPT